MRRNQKLYFPLIRMISRYHIDATHSEQRFAGSISRRASESLILALCDWTSMLRVERGTETTICAECVMMIS